MPLFGSRRSAEREAAADPAVNAAPNGAGYPAGKTNGYNNTTNGYNNNNAVNDTTSRRSTSGSSFFARSGRNSIDNNNEQGVAPATSDSLRSAHTKLDAAVMSERAADQALRDARLAVRDARDMVERLEREARREADMAAAKLKEARSLRKTAGGLGKFGTA